MDEVGGGGGAGAGVGGVGKPMDRMPSSQSPSPTHEGPVREPTEPSCTGALGMPTMVFPRFRKVHTPRATGGQEAQHRKLLERE